MGGSGPERAGLYSALAQLGMEELGSTGGLLGALLDCATEGFDSIVTLPRRKLCALALCKVCAVHRSVLHFSQPLLLLYNYVTAYDPGSNPRGIIESACVE